MQNAANVADKLFMIILCSYTICKVSLVEYSFSTSKKQTEISVSVGIKCKSAT